jgi:biopolymer transport protein TolR
MAFFGDPDRETDVLADINVTPLVDVMLVLLIIFMVATPMLHQGIEVQLPRIEAQNLPLQSEDPLVLSVNKDGLVFIKDTPVHPTQLLDRLLPLVEARGDETIFLKADREVAYGTVIEVLDVLQKGGVKNIGMVTEPGSKERDRRR